MNLHPIFNDCVAREESRYAITEPWVKGGYVCATNGQICVRQRTSEEDTKPEPWQKFPPFDSLHWPKIGPRATPADLPDIPDVPLKHGCDYCRGLGNRTCDMGHDHDCPDCGGTGEIERRPTMAVGDTTLRSDYIRLMRRHGAVVYTQGPKEPAYFTIGDIDGLLMPCNPGTDGVMTAAEYTEEAKTFKP